MFNSRPAAAIDTSSDEPPNDTNGSVRPVSGMMPTTPPTLISVWHTIQAVMPAGEQCPEAVGCPGGDAHAEPGEDEEQEQHDGHPGEAELLGDDGEDEVGVGLGEVTPLRLAGAEPDAGEPTGGDADERLPHLEALVLLVGGEVEERRPAVGAGTRA